MEKSFSTLEIINIVAWYKQARENEKKPLSELPLKWQWILKKNISAMNTVAENFNSFRDEAEKSLREEFATDEKSIIDTDENGQEIRRVKDEFLSDFQEKTNEFNKRLGEIIAEMNTIEITTINIDELIDSVGDTSNLTIDDLDILSFMGEEKS